MNGRTRTTTRFAGLLVSTLAISAVLVSRPWAAPDGPQFEVLTGVTLASNHGGGNPNQGNQGNDGPQGNAPGNPRTFGISGDLDGIHPTLDGALTVTFSSRHRFEINVDDLDVALSLSDPTSECGVALAALPGGGGLDDVLTIDATLPPGGVPLVAYAGGAPVTATVDLPVSVSNDLPDECQGVEVFDITYSGTATRENQE